MNFPENIYYTRDHEWIKFEDNIAIVGITDFAQKELGDIVYVEIESIDQLLDENEVFGTVEAVKTVSDLFLPIKGEVIEMNPMINDLPETINTDPYGNGWIIKVKPVDFEDRTNLLSKDEYKFMLGENI